MSRKPPLINSIKEKKARICIMGLGYVGLPLAIEFCRSGFQVIGLDKNAAKIARLKKGNDGIDDVSSAEVRRCLKDGVLTLSSHSKVLKNADCIVICVPTPLNKVKEPDLSSVLGAAQSIRASLRKDQIILMESTISPGTTEEIILEAIRKPGMKVGRDFYLAFSPERIDPANGQYSLRQIPKIVGGVTKECLTIGQALYGHIVDTVVPVSSPRVAEMAKLLENTFRIVNIGLMNELLPVARSLGINLWEVIDAAKTKPFGFMPFYPGPGIGGHCIGVDPLYLSWKAKAIGSELRFIELASHVNGIMPKYVVKRISDFLNTQNKPISHSRIFVLGVSYKPEVSDVRESPAIEVIDELKRLGALVSYHDPKVPQLETDRGFLKSRPLNSGTLKAQDLVVILTTHKDVDYHLVVKSSKSIFDTRNALKEIQHKGNKVILL